MHHDERRRRSRAQTSASSGSRRPLTSLTIRAPACDRGARDRRLVGVDRDERAELAGEALDQRHDPRDLLLRLDRRRARRGRLAADVEDVRPVGQQLLARARPARRAPGAAPPSLKESGDALTIPISNGRGAELAAPSRTRAAAAAGALNGRAPGRVPAGMPLGGRLGRERFELGSEAALVPAELAREHLARRAVRRRRRRAELARGEQPEAGAAQQHVADAARLLVARRERDLGEQVGAVRDDRLRQLSALAGDLEHLERGVPVARGERLVGVVGDALQARQLLGEIAWPSGISCVRQAASRASRRTSRSTVIFAIRRQVVSLPPVIVIMPEEVSYSSALREMSTDFFGSPVEISGRTPAKAPVSPSGPKSEPKKLLTASSR